MHVPFSFTMPIYLKVANPDFIAPAAIADIAQAAEALGYDEVAVYDHFLEPPEWQPSYFTSWYDPVPLLGFLAAKTERIRIASNAINIPYRHPAVMANELSTIDKLSGGRFTAGLVAGYLHEEYDTLGHDRTTRGQLADEYLDAMVTLWTNEVATYHGNYIHFDEVTLAARPAGPPELWSHGGNVRALRRAIRWCDGWGPIVGLGVAEQPEGASDQFAIGKAEPVDVADPYAELVAGLNQEHPGIHVPESKTYEWMQEQLDRHRQQIEARDRPLSLSLSVSLDAGSIDTAPERIQEQLDRGATKINLGINSESLDGFLDVVRRFGEQVLPAYRD